MNKIAKIISKNPAKNYEIIGEIEASSDYDIQETVRRANQAKASWKEIGIQKRTEFLNPIYEDFKKRSKEIAELISKEMGKSFTRSRDEVSWSLEEFKWFIKNAPAAIADEITYEDNNSIHKIVYEPFGAVALITPWNFPLGMAIWGIVPNLLVGNTVVFKISEETPLLGELIEDIFNNHDLPAGVFSEVYGSGDVGERLARSNIDFIWFTGSTRTGKLLYKIAAEKFVKVLLEMGGSSPCVVFPGVDISSATEIIYNGRFQNCGQACDAIKRLIVHESIFDQIVTSLKDLVESKKVGDPMDKDTDIGSLAAERQLLLLESQIKDAVTKGAKIVTGGERPQNFKGAFYKPTILTNITKGMRVWKEEVFGPVLPIVKFKTEEEGIELANDTVYGLTAKVLSEDTVQAERVASKIEAGTVEINSGDRWLSCNPFGGYKLSGLGREHGTAGFRELCQIKVISKNKK